MSSPAVNGKTSVPAGAELSDLAAKVSRWGTEAGFLGIEGHLEGRVLALVREASVRLFGNCDADRDLLVCRIEKVEREREDSLRKADEIRSTRQSMRTRAGLLASVLSWFERRADLRQAQAVERRTDPELRQARLELEVAERARRDAAGWREMAAQYLRATYEYRKARAAVVRPEIARMEKQQKEQSNDTRDNRQFIVHRAH